MSELDDRLTEGRRTVATMEPPEDLWARAVERSNDGGTSVHDLTVAPHRRRPSLWLAVAAVAVLLVLVGAFKLLDDDQPVDTVPVTEVPVVGEDQALAKDAALTPKDMPAGWVAVPPEDAARKQAEQDDLDRALADCLDIDVSELRSDRPTARSAFVNSHEVNEELVVSDVTVFGSVTEAQESIVRFREDAAQRCYVDVIEQQIAQTARDGLATITGRALSGDEIEVGESTITELYLQYYEAGYYWDVGDASVAFRVKVPLSSEAVEVDVYSDFALVREGAVVVQTSFQTYFTPFEGGGVSLAPRPALLMKQVVDRISAGE